MKKIVYCIASVYNSGGKDRVICLKANWFVSQGYDVYIVTTDQAGRPPYFSIDERVHLIDLGVGYEQTNGLSRLQRWRAKLSQKRLHRQLLTDCLDRIQPDIVISTMEEDGEVLSKMTLSCLKIVELHYSKVRRFNEYPRGRYDLARFWDWLRTKADERAVESFDHLVVLSSADMEAWHCMPRRSLIPNPTSFKAEELSSLQKKRILAIGRYSYEKNFETLIRLWADLAPSYPEWCLEIVGEGYLRSFFEDLVSELRLGHQIALSNKTVDAKSKYLNSSIFVLTSHYEGFSLVILEAMTCGLPVVSFDCPSGPREMIIHNKTGYLVAQNNVSEMKRALISLIENASLRFQMGRDGHARSLDFSVDVVMPQWVELFNSLKKCSK